MSTVEDQQNVAGQQLPVKRASADRLQDAPVGIRSNMAPASIETASNLAEDTVIAAMMDIAPGDNKVAMFANPFANGTEEMLYIDEQATLRWARHMNPSSPAPGPQEREGWSIDPVASSVQEVVVAVHPNGSVWAFCHQLQVQPAYNHLLVFELVSDPAVPGGYRWVRNGLALRRTGIQHFLPVQYCSDRPATPLVFVDDPSENTLYWFTPRYPADGPNGWLRGGEFQYDQADQDAPKVAGVDNPDEVFSQRPAVKWVRLWTLVDGQLFLTSYDAQTQEFSRQAVGAPNAHRSLVRSWTHPHAAGVIMACQSVDQTSMELVVPYTGGQSGWVVPLDRPTQDIVVWQDAELLLHIYGRDSDATLSVVHQVGWVGSGDLPGGSLLQPVFEQHLDSGNLVATTRPLVGSVATFALDAYPDNMPNQLVMHQGVAPGQTCAIYTQGLGTSFWHTEQMRLIPQTLPKPYTVPRYETTLTVKNAYGAAVPGCQVSLTADAAVDLEVAGRFYRTGTVTPITLYSDLRGQVTLRVVATGLSVPQLHVSAPGLAQAVTVQQACDVHKFLAGNGTLPNHGEGFTAAIVTNATNPDGTPLFPKINRGPADAAWLPSAQDVVTWCQAAFAVEAGTALPPGMLAGLAVGERVHAFTLQTHDPNRPGFQVFSSPEQLAARREALLAQGVVDVLGSWFGDIWQGLRQGVTGIAEVAVNLLDQTIELIVELADGIRAQFTVAWNDIVSAAHAVEAAFVAIGAEIKNVLDWLMWAFDMKDVWDTKLALEKSIDVMVPFITQTLDLLKGLGSDWLKEHQTAVVDAFEAMKRGVGDRRVGSLNAPALPGGRKPPSDALVKDRISDPHLSWATESCVRSLRRHHHDLSDCIHEREPAGDRIRRPRPAIGDGQHALPAPVHGVRRVAAVLLGLRRN